LSAADPVIEQAIYDSGGRLISLLDDGDRLELEGRFEGAFKNGPRWSIQSDLPMGDETNKRVPPELSWKGTKRFSDGTSLEFVTSWEESEEEVSLTAKLDYDGDPRMIEGIEYVIDLPHGLFVGGRLSPTRTPLSKVRPSDPVFYRSTYSHIKLYSETEDRSFTFVCGQPLALSVADVWEPEGRYYRIRVQLESGSGDEANEWTFKARFVYEGNPTRPVVQTEVGDPVSGYIYDGFGGNFCFQSTSPIADYVRENIHLTWSRHELKLNLWDLHRPEVDPELEADFERIQKVVSRGVPWIISAWHVPERFYVDPFAKSPKANRRVIADDKWDELLDLIAEYLTYLKDNYGVEPDYLSFNEPNLGIGLLFTPESHRDSIKRIGRFFNENGFKTKLVLGEVTGPGGTHTYLLPTAMDAEAMKYVGAIAFHSWGGATPEEYMAWAEIKEWLDVPLVVGEAGVDPFAWYNRLYLSHLYGLSEIRLMQELLRYAQPTSILYWEYTGDYRLAIEDENGEVEPTSRFWMIKQLSDLTPDKSQMLTVDLEDDEVAITAFENESKTAVHILNTGPKRKVKLSGLNEARQRRWVSSAVDEMATYPDVEVEADGSAVIELPALSLTTLVSKAGV
jgi:O-glycosyl hydrolase